MLQSEYLIHDFGGIAFDVAVCDFNDCLIEAEVLVLLNDLLECLFAHNLKNNLNYKQSNYNFYSMKKNQSSVSLNNASWSHQCKIPLI